MNKNTLKYIFFLTFLFFNISAFSNDEEFINTTYDTGDTYYGQSKNELKNGLGKYTWADGEYYIGEWKRDKFHLGIYYFKDKKKYCGEFLNNEDSGFSVYYYTNNENEKYAGENVGGKREGLGAYFYEEGDIVYGEWSENKINGYGIWYNKNNRIEQQGIFKNNELQKKSKVSRSLIDKFKAASIKAEANCARARTKVKEYLNKAYEVNSNSKNNNDNKINNNTNQKGGIGATIGKEEEGFVIIDVVRGYPAFYSGLKKGDVIYSVDDIVLGKNDDLNFVINLITGKVLTDVKIEIIREGNIKVFYVGRRDISDLVSNDQNNSDKLTYCKKKNGEIYIPQNETISRNYCYSGEIVTTKKEYQIYLNSTNSNSKSNNKNIGGIGIEIERKNFGYEISKVIMGYPGFYAGLKEGDIIHSVDDLVIGKRYNVDAIMNMINGKINTEVKIGTTRGSQYKTYLITRQDISALIDQDKFFSREILYNEGIFKETLGDQEGWIEWNLQELNTQKRELKLQLDKIKKINNKFDKNQSLDDIADKTKFFTQKQEFQKKKINDEEQIILSSNLGAIQKNKLIRSFDRLYNLISENSKLLKSYAREFEKYLKNKTKKEDNLNNNTIKIIDIDGIFYTKSNVNLRMGPNVQSKIVKTIPQGGVVEILRVASGTSDWVQVKYKDILGYVYFPLLSKEKVEVEETISINDELQIALDNLRKKEFEKAKEGLENIISNYPSDELAGMAYYWLGELFILEKNYRESALIFAEGFQKFPEGLKAADSLYKLAISLKKLDKVTDACKTLDKFLSEFPKNKLISSVNESIDKWQCPLTTNVIKNKLNNIEDEGDSAVLNNIYYNDLIKIKELIDLELISLEEYEKRKIQIIDQIINLDLSNRAGFLIKLLNENLITQDDFQYIFNSLSSSLNIEDDKNLNLEEENFSVAEMLKDLRDQNSEEKNNGARKKGGNKKEDEIIQDLSINEIDVLRQQLSSCWNAPAGAVIEKGMFVTINAKVLENGNVVPNSVRLIDTNISKINPFYEPITDSAMRTLLNPECTPLKLPGDKYEQWKNITITFDYSIMTGQ